MFERFEQASRLKLRFNTPIGSLAPEDLWDVSLLSNATMCLDELYKELNKQLKEYSEDSIIVTKNKVNIELELKFAIVKHIIEVKLAEEETAEKAVETKAKKDRILAILADKKDDALKSQSADELMELLDTL